MDNIAEIYKRDNADFSEKLEMREALARETVEKENLFNNNPFDKQVRSDWEDSLDKLHVWCNSDWTVTNSYIRQYRELNN
jgi:hypothetical protein